MANYARFKQSGGSQELRSLASASALDVPDVHNMFEVTGTTTIASIVSGRLRPGRQITLLGVSGSGVPITNTAISSATSGQISLTSDRTLNNGDALCLRQNSDGVWVEAAPQLNR